jgi:AAA ATPase domain
VPLYPVAVAGGQVLRGRAALTARIEAALVEAAAGSVAVVLVEGDPGSGKTALCRLARERAQAAGFRIVDYAAIEGEADLALAGLSGLLRRCSTSSTGCRRASAARSPPRPVARTNR